MTQQGSEDMDRTESDWCTAGIQSVGCTTNMKEKEKAKAKAKTRTESKSALKLD